jgi:hypothetical protein
VVQRPSKYFVLLTTIIGLFAGARVTAAVPASPAVEVKFYLSPPQVLDTNHQPNEALRAAFQIAKEAVKKPVAIRMQFLDGPKQELHQEGWYVRFRKIQGQEHIELTFKRRSPVDGRLDAALAQAAREGFDAAAASDYASELEWGYQKQTLAFSNEKRVGDAGERSLNLPAAGDARQLAAGDKMPDKLRQWKDEGWAKRILSRACVYGPADGWRWRGSHPDVDGEIAIEVWALPTADRTGTEQIVEISFKKNRYDAQATAKRERLLEFLNAKGWLLKTDMLKTELILERARQPGC